MSDKQTTQRDDLDSKAHSDERTNDGTSLETRIALFGERLAELDVVDRDTFYDLCRSGSTGDEISSAVESLKAAGKLTEFQAERLSSGSVDTIRFDDYVLLDKLGEGGMGEVFKARNILLGRLEAIKTILHDEEKSDALSKRFQQEARVLARLEHPSITPIYKVGRYRGIDFLSMKYIEGETLRGKVSSARKAGHHVAIRDACRWISEAADGLHHAHQLGVIHRDIKPGNLMVTGEGKLFILDMGIARLADPVTKKGAGLTVQMRGLGTPEYMPPEQWADATGVTPASDIYALGCTFFYALTGQVPYKRKDMTALMRAHMADPVPSLLEHRPDAPPELDRVLNRMLAKNASDRFNSAKEVVEQLRPYLDYEALPPATATTAGSEKFKTMMTPAEKTRRSMHSDPALKVHRQKSRVPMIAALVVVAIVVGAGIAFWNRGDNEPADRTKGGLVAKVDPAESTKAEDVKSTAITPIVEPTVDKKDEKPEKKPAQPDPTPAEVARGRAERLAREHSKQWKDADAILAYIAERGQKIEVMSAAEVDALFAPGGLVDKHTESMRVVQERDDYLRTVAAEHKDVWPDKGELERFVSKSPTQTGPQLEALKAKVEAETSLRRMFGNLTYEKGLRSIIEEWIEAMKTVLALHSRPPSPSIGLEAYAATKDGVRKKVFKVGEDIHFFFKNKRDCAVTMVTFDKYMFQAFPLEQPQVTVLSPVEARIFRLNQVYNLATPGRRYIALYATDEPMFEVATTPIGEDKPILEITFANKPDVLKQLLDSFENGRVVPGLPANTKFGEWDRAVIEFDVEP